MHLLLVEDDALLAKGIVHLLKRNGFDIDHVGEGQTACLSIKAELPDIVILDLGLPDMDGLDVLKFIQKHHPGCQVLVLSAKTTIHDAVTCLDTGAGDYMSKPFEVDELMARLRVLGRRFGTSTQAEIAIGSVILNTATHLATVASERIPLSRKEYELLKSLMEDHGAIHSREELADSLSSWGKTLESNAVDVHIHHLRKKLPPEFIETVRGIGYIIKKETAAC